MTGVYGTQVEAERDGMKNVTDSQKWKKVTILQPRSYGRGPPRCRNPHTRKTLILVQGHPGKGDEQEEQVAIPGKRQDRMDRHKGWEQ